MGGWLRMILSAGVLAASAHGARADEGGISLERGLYVARIGGCNDCHTAGYPQSGATLPQSEWLKGVAIGNRGPWGTTYASNLRLFMAALTEEQWVAHAKILETRPPMPWFNIRAMTEDDLRSLYRFIRSLGDPGTPAPDYVPPGVKPTTPVVDFMPHSPQ